MDRFVVISGCSGAGKSTLLSELQRRGYATVAEPGRRIVAEERKRQGAALPWVDPEAFARRAIDVALEDRVRAAQLKGWIFFDRCLIDAAAALEHVTQQPALHTFDSERYHPRVFIAPPWPEIYVDDEDRKHRLEEAIAEYDRLLAAFARLGYDLCLLPKLGVVERADFVLAMLHSD